MSPTARNLLSQIFVLEPNLRIALQGIMQHRFFASTDWAKLRDKQVEVPYVPPSVSHSRMSTHREVSNAVVVESDSTQVANMTKMEAEMLLHRVNKEFESF